MTNNNQSDRRRNSLWRYQLVLWIAALPIFAYTFWLAVRHRQFRYLQQRLGFGCPPRRESVIWLHAASVGEVLAAEPLLKALHQQYPKLNMVVTTVTPTGAQMVRQRLGDQAIHIYLPLDWRSAVRRFLNTLRPRCALIMETELWPNLYQACARQAIPLLVVNARVSSKTLGTVGWIRNLYRGALQHVTAILARSQKDADGFRELGAAPDIVHVVGNIKFSAAKPVAQVKPITLPRPFVLAASTHDDEELQLARLWLAMQPRDELLVIAPRHPNRSNNIVRQLESLSVKPAVRSRNDKVQADTRIYLADTLGELTGFMASAELVIMGGSFVPVGGHNLLEPAMLSKAIVFGPFMHNFTDETAGLLAQQAVIQVDNYEQLRRELTELLQDHAKRQALEERAQQFMQRNSDMLQRYSSAISRYCQLPDE
ncbi:MAG: 3-deoxy-D-manno-octulosonic acid transferase [Gammaproteobacteria bacterium]|nr:3-deoxy-D-manno-octulosonic acid transferase [Gammaproteobacteria bacterium]